MSSREEPFTWFELQTVNVDEAIAFYTSVLPWDVSVWSDGDESYTMWTAGDHMVGGVTSLPDHLQEQGSVPLWIGYVNTGDLDSKREHVEARGGRLETDVIDMGDAGRFSIATDPQGAVFALHESTTPDEGSLPTQNEPGAVSWTELTTTDVDAAWHFYESLFGWTAGERMEVAENIPYQIFRWEDRDRGGIAGNASAERPPSWLFYVTVRDIEAAAERVRDHGGTVLQGPMAVPGGDQIAQCRDPHGAAFAIHTPSGSGE